MFFTDNKFWYVSFSNTTLLKLQLDNISIPNGRLNEYDSCFKNSEQLNGNKQSKSALCLRNLEK